MNNVETPQVVFNNKICIIGFGSVGQAVLPLMFRHLKISPSQVTIISKKDDGLAIAKEHGVTFIQDALLRDNYQRILSEQVKAGDFLLNLSVDVSSRDLIEYSQEHGVIYLDTCIEPWAGMYTDPNLQVQHRSNYALRLQTLALRKPGKKPTAVITHGANPGLVSHLVKQALLNIAADNNMTVQEPKTREAWAKLAHDLNIKVIHIAERDTQVANVAKRPGEFVNTWSVDGFVSEGCQPAELGWGTHEKALPEGAGQHDVGCRSAIYLNRPGASTRVRTWTPNAGTFHAFLITHSEAISMSSYFSVKVDDTVVYRPTVHYAYHPCNDALLSMHELAGREWDQQPEQRIIFDEITDGMDELGVLLMGNKKGAYWYGSQLTIHEARKLAPYNNATSLQIASSALAGMLWAIEHPEAGIVEPDEIDFHYILKVVRPYLGKVGGHYTDWTPLDGREKLFKENMMSEDPWQFANIIVN